MVPPTRGPTWQATHPVSTNLRKPFFSSFVSAVRLPVKKRSHLEGVTSLRSKAPTALAKLSNVTGWASSGNARLKASTYSGTDWRTSSTRVEFGIAISAGFKMWAFAWASTVSARPSHPSVNSSVALYTVGALRLPFCPLLPDGTSLPSTPYRSRSWHELHDT